MKEGLIWKGMRGICGGREEGDEEEGSEGGGRAEWLHCKKRFAIFPSPAGMSLTKLSPGRE